MKTVKTETVLDLRPCRQCGQPFVPDHKNSWICSDACRKARALESSRRWEIAHAEQCRQTDQAWRDRNRERVRANKRARRAANPAYYRTKRMEWYHAHKEQERAAFAAWQEKNRAKRTAYQHDWERRTAAIRDGKARFQGSEEGFLLIRARSGYWRAQPAGTEETPGRRIGATETILARYIWTDGSWAVYPPAIAGVEVRQIAARLARTEKKRVHRFSCRATKLNPGQFKEAA